MVHIAIEPVTDDVPSFVQRGTIIDLALTGWMKNDRFWASSIGINSMLGPQVHQQIRSLIGPLAPPAHDWIVDVGDIHIGWLAILSVGPRIGIPVVVSYVVTDWTDSGTGIRNLVASPRSYLKKS